MNIVIGTVLLWLAAAWLWTRLPDADAQRRALHGSRRLLVFILPRIVTALIGAALFAELLPADRIEASFGAEAGFVGLALAALLGPITPGGAFVSFAIGAAALRVGATEAAVITYVTSWSLFSLSKALAYEAPLMGGRTVALRFALSLPVPFAIGSAALALG